ncbi:MAG: exodeoxyribonuclease VII large subunit [Lachnospiraceae bacterium]|nr:exodeoxyribonuclease VII large subunit [Lachnospiraceae bacterium]
MQSVYTVSQVNSYIKNMFTQDFMLQTVLVKGEVSNCKYHSSGHIYFTLKDEKGTIACVMFAGNRAGLKFRLQEGQQVIVGGSIDVYERDGKYQLYAKQILADGTGVLHERFERLKRELEQRGMFAPQYKQPIPKYIKRLGVVTAPTGAAVQDIINIASRRNPYVQIILYPAIVQGEEAAWSIVNGIRAMERQNVDVIIVGRGGGSIEDLWAFNEEIVAQAVFDCSVPIISAVGHETDTTIIDFVADMRAPTPSAAAELAVYDYRLFLQQLSGLADRLSGEMARQIRAKRKQVQQYTNTLGYLSPVGRIREKRMYSLKLEDKLQILMRRRMEQTRHRLEIYIEKMRALSPLDKLNQGFSYLSDEQGINIRSVRQVEIGQELRIQVSDGQIRARVTDKEERDVTGR